ncbi:MAG: hypothetical protein AAGG75_20765 [Bacteroidota bacterium]
MRQLHLYLLLGGLCLAAQTPDDYQTEIGAAKAYLLERQHTLDQVAAEFPENELQKVIATVFPELIRYELFRDFFETKALELAYTQGGSTLADFSIGPFQMKPSFVETLEFHIQHRPRLHRRLHTLLIPSNQPLRQARQQRLTRLQSFEWQCRYAQAVHLVLRDCYPTLASGSDEDWLRFCATAYNYGFHRPIEDIQAWSTRQVFPYGQHFEVPQQAYADFSWNYYNTP